MAENISLSVFGTFGNPNGFKQTVVGGDYKIKLFDLNPNAIQLFQNSELLAIRKEMVTNNQIISFIKYSFAQEQGSSRGGTFVGASVICTNGVPDLAQTAEVLNQLHHNLVSNPHNVQNGIIMVKHSDDYKVNGVNGVDRLKVNSSEISDIDFNEKNRSALVYISLNNAAELFRKSLDLLNIYDTIYFTQNSEVAEYVNKKGLFELLEKKSFNQKINQLESQKMAHQNKELEKLSKYIDQLKEEATKTTSEYLEVINKNKKTHQENGERISKSEIEYKELVSKYQNAVQKLEESKVKLSNGRLKKKELNAVLEEFKQGLNNFLQEKNKFSKPNEINTISEARKPISRNSNRINTPEKVSNSQFFSDSDNKPCKHSRKGSLDIKKLVILGLLFFTILGGLVLGVYMIYDKFISPKNKNATTTTSHIEDNKHNNEQEIINNEDEEVSSLEPKPNAYLSEDDVKNTIERQLKEKELPMHKNEVVTRIFKANLNDVNEIYKEKKTEYGEYFKNENQKLFRDDSLISTNGLKIPIFKKGNNETQESISTVDDIQHR